MIDAYNIIIIIDNFINNLFTQIKKFIKAYFYKKIKFNYSLENLFIAFLISSTQGEISYLSLHMKV